MSTFYERLIDLAQASDDCATYEHNEGCQGEPNCPACWAEGIRNLLVDFPEEVPPVGSREHVAKSLLAAFVSGKGDVYDLADHLLAAGVFRDEAAAKADALREAAEVQRTIAAASRTRNGKAEADDIADWLEGRADEMDPRRLKGAHP